MEKADIYGYIIVAVVLLLMAFIAWALCRTAGNSDDREEEYWSRRKEGRRAKGEKDNEIVQEFQNQETTTKGK